MFWRLAIAATALFSLATYIFWSPFTAASITQTQFTEGHAAFIAPEESMDRSFAGTSPAILDSVNGELITAPQTYARIIEASGNACVIYGTSLVLPVEDGTTPRYSAQNGWDFVDSAGQARPSDNAVVVSAGGSPSSDAWATKLDQIEIRYQEACRGLYDEYLGIRYLS